MVRKYKRKGAKLRSSERGILKRERRTWRLKEEPKHELGWSKHPPKYLLVVRTKKVGWERKEP